MKRLGISVIALVSALAIPAKAQEIELEEIVVSANRTDSERNRTGVSVGVVAQADLSRNGASVKETLSREPGFSVASQGPFGNTSNLTLRGAQGRYISVFVDGIRVDDPSSVTTSYEFGTMMASGIGRIEVLRGSQSALWGGSAVAGVIAVESPRATEDGTQQMIEVEGGSYGSAKLSYGLTQKTGALEMTLSASHIQTNGFSAAAAGTEADGAKADRLSFGVRYSLGDAVTIGGNVFLQKLTQDYDGFASVPPFAASDADKVQQRDETGVRVFAEVETGATQHVFSLSSYKVARDYFSAGLADGSYDGKRTRLDWTATTELSPALTLVYGADVTDEAATVNSIDPVTFATTTTSESVMTAGVFAQALLAIDDTLDLSGTLRSDHNETFGGFTTGRVALAWRPQEDLTLRAAVATGFRAPSLNELYADYSAFGYANNPNLEPETSQSAEVGVEKVFANGASLSLTAFRLNIDNRIGNACIAPVADGSCPAFQYILDNFAGKSVRKGVELSAQAPIDDRTDLKLSYAYVDAKTVTGGAIGGVSRHNLNLVLDHDLTDRLSMNVGLRHVAGLTDVFSTAPLADFTTVDLGASFAVTDQAEAYVRIHNAFDKSYQESSGYGTAGRSVFVGLRAKF
jgi:vitamin B12 transporter